MKNENNEQRKEIKMTRFRTKIAIFIIALLLSTFGFNLIANSPALDLLKVGKAAGYEIIANYLAKEKTASHHSSLTRG